MKRASCKAFRMGLPTAFEMIPRPDLHDAALKR